MAIQVVSFDNKLLNKLIKKGQKEKRTPRRIFEDFISVPENQELILKSEAPKKEAAKTEEKK